MNTPNPARQSLPKFPPNRQSLPKFPPNRQSLPKFPPNRQSLPKFPPNRQSLLKRLPAAALLLAALLTVIPACRGDANPTAAPAAAVTPAPAASPRPLTAAERADLAAFLTARQTIAEAQEQLRQDLDDWQARLTACHPAAAQDALRDFAAAFTPVTQQARNLPRGPRAQELADTLIPAAEAEEAALRQLRDRWQPHNLTLFETLEIRRSQSAAARNTVNDLLRELRKEYAETPSPQEIAAMQEFAPAFAELETAWNEAHNAYAALIQEQGDYLEIAPLLARYQTLTAQFAAIAQTIQTLQPPPAAETHTQNLRQAIDAELEALQKVTDLLNRLSAQAPPTPEPAPPDAAATPPPGGIPPAPTPDAQPLPSPQALLADLAAAVAAAQTALAAAGQTIQDTIDDESAEILAALSEFETAYASLTAQWDAAQAQYRQWRQTDGGCDRAQTLADLQQFARRAADLTRQTRQLPQTGPLLPIQALLTDAAAREETALRALPQTWRPFTAHAFAALTQQQTAAANLRRQAQTALTQLQTRRP